MYLRLKTGRMAGQIREVSVTAGRAMLADGRAEREDEEPNEIPAELATAKAVSEPEAGKTASSAPQQRQKDRRR